MLVRPQEFLVRLKQWEDEKANCNAKPPATKDNIDAKDKPVKKTIAIACKRVPSKKIGRLLRDHVTEAGDQTLLFRACQYGNNKHKKKLSTAVTAQEYASFHASLGQIIKSLPGSTVINKVNTAPTRKTSVKTTE